jgi:hypothetical protein
MAQALYGLAFLIDIILVTVVDGLELQGLRLLF